ncbi:MAG: bis(5'-nucleosyl)-tetraphosphatase (symmetrical) YqeK [Clostridia bacterium]|nr:bis(5'-nucleosyl)-tetraphosphatase (symmetrical) YqeK [Clostridia bacterium]
MRFTDNELNSLRLAVKDKLSPRRYNHTLGVERAAAMIAEKCAKEPISEIRAAALLHDITKEFSHEEQLVLIEKYQIKVTESDLMSPETLHALTASPYIIENYPHFADELVLSAISCHTVGRPDMDVAEAIIFVADFIEEGRTYDVSVRLREKLYSELDKSGSILNMVLALCCAVIESITCTVSHLEEQSMFVHPVTLLTRDAFIKRRDEILRLVDSGKRT